MDREPTSAKEFAPASAHIGPERVGLRLQEALVDLFPDWLPSRKSCRKAIDRGEVCCNGKANTALRVETGDRSTIGPSRPTPVPSAGPRLHRPVKRTSFVWKPAGIATSGGARHLAASSPTAGTDARGASLGRTSRRHACTHPAHRLDRATSGWICVALTLPVAGPWDGLLPTVMDKRYLALAPGLKTVSETPRWQPANGVAGPRHGPLPVHGRPPCSGPTDHWRTHQIRRHLADLGHPLVGEDAYTAPGMDLQSAPRYSGHGLFLCAIGLSIPEGKHGPATDLTAPVPRKYKRIRWAAEALTQHGYG